LIGAIGAEAQEGIHVEACDRDPFATGDTPGTWAPRPDVVRERRRLHRTFVLQRDRVEGLQRRTTTLCVAAGSPRRRATRLRGEAAAARHAP
jgi:hypothetical protein